MRVLRTLADEDRHVCSRSASRRWSPPSSTTRTASTACITGWPTGGCARPRPPACARLPVEVGRLPSCTPEALRAFGIRECAEADRRSTTSPRCGGTAAARCCASLIDAGTMELLGGPLAHPFQPLLAPRLREFALREGLADARQRLAHTPERHLGARVRLRARAWNTTTPPRASRTSWSTARRCTATPRWAGRSATPTSSRSGATCRSATGCGRRSPAIRGTPPTATSTPTTTLTGLKPATGHRPQRGVGRQGALRPRARRPRGRRPRRRLRRGGAQPAARPSPSASAGPPTWSPRSTPSCSGTGGTRGRRGWSGCCARCPRPACGSARSADALADGFVGDAGRLAAQLLGFGQGLAGVGRASKVADLVQLNTEVVDTALTTVDKALAQTASLDGPLARDRVADQILRETLLTVSSDWPFMVSKDSAADYARYRAHLHAHATREIAGALASGRRDSAQRLADGWNRADGLFGALDARRLPPMKILMVSWEYPPVVIGGLGRHVHHLSTALAAAGHEVVVLSPPPRGHRPQHAPVVRRDQRGRAGGRGRAGSARIRLRRRHDGLDAGDGARDDPRRAGSEEVRAATGRGVPTSCTPTTGWSPIPLSPSPNSIDVPMVSTIHATEAGRHSGWVVRRDQPPGARGRVVAGARIRFAHHLFGVDERRDHRAVRSRPGRDHGDPQRNRRGALAVRAPAGRAPGPAELLYVGRLEYEKGVHDAIAALPRIRRTHPGTTLTIAGDGTQQDWLVEQARKHKVLKATRFVGQLDHDELLALLHRRRRRGAAQPLRAVRHRRARGRRGRHSAGDLQRRRSGRGGDQRRRPGCPVRRATWRRWPRRCAPCSTIPTPRSAAPSPPANGSPPTSTGTPWPSETAQVYLAAKRRERQPQRAAAHRRARAARPLGLKGFRYRSPARSTATGVASWSPYRVSGR